MTLSIDQIKHIQSLGDDNFAIDQFAESLDMSFGELMEHLDNAKEGIGLTDDQYDAIFDAPILSNEYKELRKTIELLGDTITKKQWDIFADSARSLSASELRSIQDDPLFFGMYGQISEITAERGIW